MFNDPADEIQAEPGPRIAATVAGLALPEPVERPFHVLRSDADALVATRNATNWPSTEAVISMGEPGAEYLPALVVNSVSTVARLGR